MTTQQIDQRLAQLGITYTSFEVFLAYARDAGNWGGTPCIGGNVGGSPQERGNLTQLKKAGLILTFRSDRCDFVQFTKAGRALADEMGVPIVD
jgi:hypothetical protein